MTEEILEENEVIAQEAGETAEIKEETPEIIEPEFVPEPEIVVGDTVYYLPGENGTISCFARWKFDPEAMEAPEPIVPGYDGKYYFESQCPEKPEPTKEEQQQARQAAYKAEVDPLMSQYTRKKTFNLFEEGEEEALLDEINAKVEDIKQRFPYPVNSYESEEVI